MTIGAGARAGTERLGSGLRWSNRVPGWIEESGEFCRERASKTLQAIADRCDTARVDGSLIGAFGGVSLISASGVARSTFWLHVSRLELLGWLVLLARGGTIRLHTENRTRWFANVYAIPGSKGCLDTARARRAVVQFFDDADGVRRRVVVDPGSNATFWAPSDLATNDRTTLVRKSDYPSPKIGRHHTPYTIPLLDGNTIGVSAKKRGKPGFHIERADLADNARLCRVYLRAVAAGLLADSEGDIDFCFAAAEHALRIGTNPAGLFAATLRDRERLGPNVTECDGDAGAARLRAVKRETR